MSDLAGSDIRKEPYRLFFPLGWLLGVVGVGHWLLLAFGWSQEYRSIFHSMIQVQGFLVSFAAGFLFTMLPKRTSTGPATWLQIGVAAICPLGVAICAWFERWVLAQVFWLVLTAVLLHFVLARLGPSAPRRAPVAFLWIPVALLCGIGGAILTGIGAALGQEYWSLHELGRNLVLQGTFLSLVLGVGSLAIPLMTGHSPPTDAGDSPRDPWHQLLHALAALLLISSFVIEARSSLASGLGLRASVVWLVLLLGARIWRRPAKPGLNRWLILSAAWCLPIGYTVAALFPEIYKGGLHISFIGGFALLAFSVSSQVILGHGGYDDLKEGWPTPLLLLAVGLASAVFGRVMMEARQEQLLWWMAWAALSFLFAAASWASLLLPRLFRAAE